jgi:hypothetical protein
MKEKLKIIIAITFLPLLALAQNSVLTQQDIAGRDTVNTITTAVPFLMIAPDSRSGALGDAGVAISPDANAAHWNPSKLAFLENKYGGSVSYTPWLRNLINDMSLSYLSGYYKVSKERAFAASLLYFDLGSMQLTDINGQPMGDARPREFAFNVSYAQKLSQYLSLGLGIRYIHSRLTDNMPLPDGTLTRPGNTASADLSAYYRRDVTWGGMNGNFALGTNISNLGAKISYTNNDKRDFIPTNLRLGTCYRMDIDEYNSFSFIFDVNKLMVPTQPVYVKNQFGGDSIDINNKKVVLLGKDPDRPLLSGVLGSFNDAPRGFREEVQEIAISAGVEYWYQTYFAVRMGYFHENKFKGNRQYATVGFGIKYQVIGFDFAYLIPTQPNNPTNPLANTLRFSLNFDFAAQGKEDTVIE